MLGSLEAAAPGPGGHNPEPERIPLLMNKHNKLRETHLPLVDLLQHSRARARISSCAGELRFASLEPVLGGYNRAWSALRRRARFSLPGNPPLGTALCAPSSDLNERWKPQDTRPRVDPDADTAKPTRAC
jgi:hypothetical protein